MTERHRRAGAVRPALGVVGALGLLGGALLVLGQRGALLVHQCVGDGGAGWLGLRLALLRHDAACPSGTLGVGPDSRQALAVVVLVAVPVLLVHLVAAAAGLGLAAHVRLVVLAVVGALGRPLRSRPTPGQLVLRPVRPRAISLEVRAPGPVDVAVPLRRGPPLLFA